MEKVKSPVSDDGHNIHDDTWNVFNMQLIIPNSKKWIIQTSLLVALEIQKAATTYIIGKNWILLKIENATLFHMIGNICDKSYANWSDKRCYEASIILPT